MEGITAKTVSGKAADEAFKNSTADFAIKLFQQTRDGNKNSLISPLSVMLALSMTANGAKGETLAQMEALLGGDIGRTADIQKKADISFAKPQITPVTPILSSGKKIHWYLWQIVLPKSRSGHHLIEK